MNGTQMTNQAGSPNHQAPLPEGTFLGSYRILEHLDRGTRWDVYLAKSGSSHRQVALKVSLDSSAAMPPAELVEADHPGLVRVYEVGEDRGLAFVAQERVEGPRGTPFTVAQEMHNHGGTLPEERVRVIAKQLLDALHYAHRFQNRGLMHGRLSADKLLLTRQRRAKVLDAGFGPAVDPARADEARARDIRAAGGILYEALTGRVPASDAPPPSALGVAPFWDRIIQPCLGASAERLPDLAELRDFLLTAAEPSRRGFLPIAAALVVLLLLAGGAAVGVRRHRARLLEAEAQRLEAERAAREEKIGKFLDFAQASSARMKYEAARKAVWRVLQVAPGHPRATRMLADIRIAEGLARIGDSKTAAEEAWAKVQELDPGQGMDKRIAGVEQHLVLARNAMAELDFDAAGKEFEWIAAESERLLTASAERDRAAEKRSEAATARDGAEIAEAEEFAADLWQEGRDRMRRAEQAFEAQRFAEAERAWQNAWETYVEATRKAGGSRRVKVAKKEFEALRDGAGESVTGVIPDKTKAEIDGLVAQAEKAVEKRDWDGAEALYDQAQERVRESISLGTKVLRKQHYMEAMRRAKENVEKKAFALAREAIEEAMKVEGFQDDPLAARLLALVRRAQMKAAPRVSRYGKKGNLVLNGDFSEGEGGAPLGWQKPDNLTVYWEDGGVSGKCLRLDTDVYRSEWEEHRKHPDRPFKKTPTTGTRYNTVGGTAGVAVYSRPIPVERDAWYLIGYDVKAAAGEPFLYIKGYWRSVAEELKDQGSKIFFEPFPDGPSFSLTQMGTSGGVRRPPVPGDYIQCYRRRIVARFPPDGKNTWRHFASPVYFDGQRNIQVVLLEIYAFWPPGDYRFDNVSMKRISEEQAKALQDKRKALGGAANFGTPSRKK